MKVAILGAGVIGVTTAYYASQLGLDVIVFDRQPGPSLETSYANAGEISSGYAAPWAAPGVPLKAIKWIFMRNGPLVIRPSTDPDMLFWLVQFSQNCTASAYRFNKGRMLRLAS